MPIIAEQVFIVIASGVNIFKYDQLYNIYIVYGNNAVGILSVPQVR